MMGRAFRFALLVCFVVGVQEIFADDSGEVIAGEAPTCQRMCQNLNVDPNEACRNPAVETPKEEVIIVTNGSSQIRSWKWDTITMVVSTYFDTIQTTGLAACVTHSKGKRFGWREPVPGSDDISKIMGDIGVVKNDFKNNITVYQKLLMADHVVFDLVDFSLQLENTKNLNKSLALSKMTEILSEATVTAQELTNKNYVYCIVPWQPPCPESDCRDVQELLSHCHILLMSPDSYVPVAPDTGICEAQATVPITKFLYGVDRYIALAAQPNTVKSIVAGIPWHGYVYNCDSVISDDNKCKVNKEKGTRCFDNTNRQRQSLSHIHSLSIPTVDVHMDPLSKGVFYKVNGSSQMWYENFTTLYLKYMIVQDLGLRGLSIWYGEDMMTGLNADKMGFVIGSWDFLTHHVLHKAVYHPTKPNHVYADTVAGVGVGCLLLGTALGVIFTCIAFRRNSIQRRHPPFRLDEVEDDFRDDEGL